MFSFWKSRVSDNAIYTNDHKSLFLEDIQNIDKTKFINWNKNRPPDLVRISHLHNYYETNNVELVPGIVSVWVVEEKNYVYDGIHRLLSAFECKHPIKVLIYYYYTSKEQDIIDDFLAINKSVSVPSIYLEEDNHIKKTVCLSVADYMCQKYPKFVSPSRRPYKYNFNRDNLIEFISELEIDFTKSSVDKILKNEFDGLNLRAQQFIIRNNISCPNKCNVYGFWLFYLDKYLIKSTLEETVKRF